MKGKKHRPEVIIKKLLEADAMLAEAQLDKEILKEALEGNY